MVKEEVEKLYWDIGELSEMIARHPSAIRFWLEELELDHLVHRSHKGDRKFTKHTVNIIVTVDNMVRTGYTLLAISRMVEAMGLRNKPERVLKCGICKHPWESAPQDPGSVPVFIGGEWYHRTCLTEMISTINAVKSVDTHSSTTSIENDKT